DDVETAQIVAHQLPERAHVVARSAVQVVDSRAVRRPDPLEVEAGLDLVVSAEPLQAQGFVAVLDWFFGNGVGGGCLSAAAGFQRVGSFVSHRSLLRRTAAWRCCRAAARTLLPRLPAARPRRSR